MRLHKVADHSFRQLTELHLGNIDLCPNDLQQLSLFPQLELIDLSGVPCVNDSVVEQIVHICPTVTSFILDECPITDKGLMSFTSQLRVLSLP